MIRALIAGELVANPQERTCKTVELSPPPACRFRKEMKGGCSAPQIAFNDDVVAAMVALSAVIGRKARIAPKRRDIWRVTPNL